MSAIFIEEAINKIGKDLNFIINTGTLSVASEKIKLFPEDDGFHIVPLKGVELQFYEKTECLEAVCVTLRARSPWSKVYTGALPDPYKLSMSFHWIRETFGSPYKAQGPKAMPRPMLYSGGWDNYRLPNNANVEIYVSYSENLEVSGLKFSLINTGHD